MEQFTKKFFIVKEATYKDARVMLSTFGTDNPPPASDGNGRLVAFAISRFEVSYLQFMGLAMKEAHNAYIKQVDNVFVEHSIVPCDQEHPSPKILTGGYHTIAHTLYPWLKVIPSMDSVEIDEDLKEIICNRGFVEISEQQFAKIPTSVNLFIEVPINYTSNFCFIITDQDKDEEDRELHTYIIGIEEMLVLHFN